MTKFVNCTPHAITVYGLATIPASGIVARCTTQRDRTPGILLQSQPVFYTVRLIRQTLGEVQDLPAPVDGTIYIASGMVLQALAGSRSDVVAPDTGADAIRENGQIVAVMGFVC